MPYPTRLKAIQDELKADSLSFWTGYRPKKTKR